METALYQSPYKGFNREAKKQKYGVSNERINPPIRGSIDDSYNEMLKAFAEFLYQSPYKGFNSFSYFLLNHLSPIVSIPL